MKALLATTVLFISLLAFQKGPSAVTDGKVTGVFQGMDDEGVLSYKTDDGKVVLFHELGDDVDYDLLEDEYIGKKFEITWKDSEQDVYDDEDEPTGETVMVKQITNLKLIR